MSGDENQSDTALLAPAMDVVTEWPPRVPARVAVPGRHSERGAASRSRRDAVPSPFEGTTHTRPSLLVGSGDCALFAAQEVIAARNGFSIIGIVAEENEFPNPWLAGIPILGSTHELPQVVRRTGARAVVVAGDKPSHPELEEILESCRRGGTEVFDVPALIEEMTGRIPVDRIHETWLEEVLPLAGKNSRYPGAKRGFDIAISSFILAIFLPLFPLLALAIFFSTRGTPILVQDRVGLNGRTIRLMKLRSMVANAESSGTPVWAETEDHRVTRIGRFLRRTRLDEVPQVVNVLRGDMSLIGPRPERPYFVEKLRAEMARYNWRHSVLPGITGWAQVNQGYAASVEASLRKLEFDLYYVKNRSLALDISILARTVGVVFGRRGAR